MPKVDLKKIIVELVARFKKLSLYARWLLGFWAFFLLIFFLNFWIDSAVEDVGEYEKSRHKRGFAVVQDFIKRHVPYARRVRVKTVRRTILDPGRQFAINRFLVNGKEVARFKSVGEKISEFKGRIPDGKVDFINDTDKTYGVEYFRGNYRHGPYMEYYEGGQLRRDAVYSRGRLQKEKIYFIDGVLRMEADYTDALRFVEDREAGAGKIYFRNGKLRYEWRLTNDYRGGYKKSYDLDGKLVEEKYYDYNADQVKKEQVAQPIQEAVAVDLW